MSALRAIALAAGVLLLAGCGSSSGDNSSASSSESTAETSAPAESTAATTSGQASLTIRSVDPSKYLQGSSVGFGEGPAPSFSAAVKRAAARAGCKLRADPSAVGIHLLVSDIVPLHVDNPDYSKVPRPPTNGHHRPIWANWGFYQQPVPYAYEVHNLEHGGVAIHLGLRTTRADGTKVVRMWADSPPYVLVVPGLPADVPQRGVTVTSWQRAMLCKTWNARTQAAIRTYRDVYRGSGPEQIPSLNSGASANDLPTPALANPTG